MEFKLEVEDLSELMIYDSNRLETIVDEDRGIYQDKFLLPKGNVSYKQHIVREELSILEGSYCMNQDIRLGGKGTDEVLEMYFNLSSKSIYYKNKIITTDVVPLMSGNLIYIPQSDEHMHIGLEKDVAYTTFDLHLPKNMLMQYAGESRILDDFLEEITLKRSASLCPNQIRVNSAVYAVIQTIQQCNYIGLTRKIFLESKVFELIALAYNGLERNQDPVKLSSADQQFIHYAAQLIKDHLDNPYTIIQLARKVGINQTKLKDGFKVLYGTTVFNYMQTLRMNKAHASLLSTHLSIYEISLASGFKNTSNFSASFKKVFGYSPSQLRK